MTFDFSFYTALGICLAGTFFRMGKWFFIRIGPEADRLTIRSRLAAALGSLLRALTHRRIFSLAGSAVADILFQRSIFRQNRWRWLMHICLFYGMFGLVFMHALDTLVTARLFSDYESPLNPFFFLRNFFGSMVIIGTTIALVRRAGIGPLRRVTRPMDTVTLALIAVIIASGVLLEAAKIVSEPVFDDMVDEYMDEDDEDILAPLRAYWAAENGVVFAKPVDSDDPAVIARGRDTHEEYCLSCHAPAASAFMSHAVARAGAPLARAANRIRLDTWLWYVHFLAAFAALAWLPFGKLFHLIATPLNLLIRSGASASPSPAQTANRRALALDACTHCGVCSTHCKVAPILAVIGNPAILPSEKLAALARDVSTRKQSADQTARLAEGSFICTACGRCTEVCPSGIDLADLWRASKQTLTRRGFTTAHHWIMGKTAHEWAQVASRQPAKTTQLSRPPATIIHLTDRPEIIRECIQCTICTAVCPVVAAAADPARELDLTPQQIMNLLRLNMIDSALGARMVWHCVTCYLCQEHCPQGIPVADVLYELRNIAQRQFHPAPVAVDRLPHQAGHPGNHSALPPAPGPIEKGEPA